MSHEPGLRSFFMCSGGEWIPAGDVPKQALTVKECQDHPHWGVEEEFEIYVLHPETGAPEKIDCHSLDHMTARPYIVLNGPNVTTLPLGQPYVELGAVVYDSDARITRLENAQVQTSTVPVDHTTAGEYYIQYSAMDASGHAAFPVVRQITVVDPDPPFVPEASNVGISCLDIKTRRPESASGIYWVDPDGSGTPFQVSCEMERDGGAQHDPQTLPLSQNLTVLLLTGGWFKIKLFNQFIDDLDYSRTFDSFRVAMWQWLPNDPWKKCSDDSTIMYQSDNNDITITQSMVIPIAQNDPSEARRALDKAYRIGYADPDESIGERTWVELNAIRGVITELHPQTRMVATTADDDTHGVETRVDGRLEGEGSHEVYIYNEQNQEMLLTPGHDGECGGATETVRATSSAVFLHTRVSSRSLCIRRA